MYTRLLGSQGLADIMARFPLLCGMDCYFLDALGNVSLTAPRRPANAFIHLLKEQKDSRDLLEKNRQALLAGQEVSAEHAGYHEIVHRLFLENETIGYLLLSACRDNRLDHRASRQAWIRLAGEGSRIPWRRWSKHWSALPELTQEQRQAWRQTLRLCAQEALRQLEADLHPEQQALPLLVRRACEEIRSHHKCALHLKDVAARLNVSAEHLSRLFHQSTGLRFREYLAETRIASVCEALENTDLPISDIAHDCGFHTLSRFNQCFRTHRNMTPRDWRRRAQRQHPPKRPFFTP